MPGENTSLEAVRCRKCRYMVRETERVCGRCGAPITARNILAGHVTALIGSIGVALYFVAMGFSSHGGWMIGVGIGLGALGIIGVASSFRRIQRLRGDFPSARARLKQGKTDPTDDQP